MNSGYENDVNRRVTEVNGIKIRNLQDLIATVEDGSETPYVVFKTTGNKTIALDRKKAEDEHGGILELYQIAADRSVNLETVVSRKKTDANNLADLVTLNPGVKN